MRKLVSIREVKEIKEHPNADLLEIAVIDGWECVVKKESLNAGEKCVYFEIDSYLPIIPEFDFLVKTSFKKMGEKEGIRLKTIRFREVLSQGLALPLDSIQRILEENIFNAETPLNLEVGSDITEWLGVEKYEAPIPANLSGSVEGDFPSFIRKTDQERIQNVWEKYSADFTDNNEKIIEELSKEGDKYLDRIEELKTNRTVNPIKDMEFEVSLKLDGTSMTCFVIDTEKYQTKKINKLLSNGEEVPKHSFGVCGRNWELTETTDNTYWKVANRDIKERLLKYCIENGRNLAIQGELMGEGIQKNREKIKGHKFFLFDVWDIDNQRYFTSEERNKLSNELLLEEAPILEKTFKPFKVFKTISEILDYAEGESINNPIREGVVFKSKELINGNVVSFKSISNLFLLEGGN